MIPAERRPPSKRAPERRPAKARPAKARSAKARRRAPRPGQHHRRTIGILVVLCLAFGAVVVRLGQLQVVGADRYVALGDQQRIRPVELAAARGTLFDRNGADLALSVDQRTAWADPLLVTDPAAAAAELAPILGTDAGELEEELGSSARFVYLGRQLGDDAADQVEALALEGVFVVDEPKRFNPSGSLGRSILGEVDIDNVGVSGLERQYDDVLTGEPGQLVIERDPDGRTIPAGEHELVPATPGDDLMLTIDRALQFEAERLLGDQIVAMGAKAGSIVVMNPQTGEILAMANLAVPTSADADAVADLAADPGTPVPTPDNRALTVVYEPGSVNKVITLAAALEEGITSPQEVLSVPDRLVVADHTFVDHDPHPVAQWSPTDIMTTSSNVGTIMLGQALGAERIDDYLQRFGFGQRSGLGFPGESPGILLDPEDWSGTAIGSIPIGQTIAVTAMQMLAAYNVIANGGVYVEPTLVRGTVDADGVARERPAGERRRVVSDQVARQVRDMMVNVVDQGTGTAAAIDGYRVAGKTGTARKPAPTGGYTYPDGGYRYVTTFAGFVPAEDPQLSVIVVIDEPMSSIFASAASAPVFADLARYGLRLLRIPPPAQPEASTVPAPVAGIATAGATTGANEVPGGSRPPPPAEAAPGRQP